MAVSIANDLDSPLELPCGVYLSNRLVKSAMSEELGDQENAPTLDLLRLYDTFAASGAGLLLTGHVMLDRSSRAETGNLVLADPRHLPAFAEWATRSRVHGAEIWMQMNHPGRQVPRSVSPDTVAPSAVPLEGFGPLFGTPRALEVPEIEEIIQRFGRTAHLAQEAGFGGVQIHAAHGYLISQFLSPRTNLRDDAWGGDPERRRRFLLEVVREVRKQVQPDFAVSVKLNSADFQRGGFTEEESLAVVQDLNDEALDLLEISGGTYEQTEMWRSRQKQAAASTHAREAYFLEYAEKIRGAAQMPLLLTGGFRSRQGIAEALASGAIDLAGMARPFLTHPRCAADLLAGRIQAIPDPNLQTGFKKADAVIQITWYKIQLERLAAGLEPAPGLSRLRALGTGLYRNLPRSSRKI
jgi:2,4-dienoyl-CoA reductase-like NADH-dependent reductase (Old Yellow Enzyme family)